MRTSSTAFLKSAEFETVVADFAACANKAEDLGEWTSVQCLQSVNITRLMNNPHLTSCQANGNTLRISRRLLRPLGNNYEDKDCNEVFEDEIIEYNDDHVLRIINVATSC
jgi:hypothetical protein